MTQQITLEFYSANTVPDKSGNILVAIKDNESYFLKRKCKIYSSYAIESQPVTFLNNEVLGWCYIDFEQLEKELCALNNNLNFNPEYLNWLHDHAVCQSLHK